MLHTIAVVWLWIMVPWLTLGVVSTAYYIGKPRKPLTSGTATITIVSTLLTIVALVTLLLS